MDFNHALTGVGGKIICIVAKFKDVPMLGSIWDEDNIVKTMFDVV